MKKTRSAHLLLLESPTLLTLICLAFSLKLGMRALAGQGSLVFSKPRSDYPSQLINHLTITPSGNRYVIGTEIGNNNSAFLRGYSNTFEPFLNTRSGAYPGFDARYIASNSEGIFVSGAFSSTIDFFGQVIEPTLNSSDAYLARFSPGGVLLWITALGGEQQDVGTAAAVDEEGNSFLTGFFSGRAVYRGGEIRSRGAEDAFVAKFDKNGTIWLLMSLCG